MKFEKWILIYIKTCCESNNRKQSGAKLDYLLKNRVKELIFVELSDGVP